MATLDILSIDLKRRTLVYVRNYPAPVIFIQEDNLTLLDEPAEPIYVRRGIRPSIIEILLAPNIVAISYTDGLSLAGGRKYHLDSRPPITGIASTSNRPGTLLCPVHLGAPKETRCANLIGCILFCVYQAQ